MNDTAIKNFCLEARHMLEQQVEQCAVKYGVVEEGAPASDAVAVGEVALTELQRSQRAQLLELQAGIGHEELVRRAAYTWFNRLVAIRFMEVNGYLPSGVRVLSAPDGTFSPEILTEALRVSIYGIDQAKVLELLQSGDDEPLFRYLFLLQCQELAECLPSVFEPVGGAMELLLPDGLSRKGSVADLLVSSLPETEDDGTPSDTWQNVEALGWMYQYYNAERKDEFFTSKRKAAAEDLAPATQLFTPKWIVRYMVENSLGRLWMLNHPDSGLRQHMDYYIEPDAEHEDFLRIGSPEEISFCDPACGSGHILSYAFELLFLMYKESGYREREIPSLILEKNLSGFEIDRRAAQIANLVLALRARKHDRRFFGRGVQASVCVLESIPFQDGELTCCGKPLAEALAHLGEVGSLLAPTEDDLQNLREELANCEGDLFAAAKADKLKLAIGKCEQLARRFDVVVANPPYMGLRRLNSWFFDWVKKNYTAYSSDLYACFMAKVFDMVSDSGYCSLVTQSTWTTDKGLYDIRSNVTEHTPIVCMLRMAANVMPIAFETTSTVFCKSELDLPGVYSDVVAAQLDSSRQLTKSSFGGLKKVKRKLSMFRALPDSVISFSVTESMVHAFAAQNKLADLVAPRVGIQTGNTERFIRLWWEVDYSDSLSILAKNEHDAHGRWVPYKNGGEFRKWYGNSISVVDWGDAGEILIGEAGNEGRKVMSLPVGYRFKPFVSWCDYGLGRVSFRYSSGGGLFDVIEPAFVDTSNYHHRDLMIIQGFANSSSADCLIKFYMPGRHKNVRKMGQLPLLSYALYEGEITENVEICRLLSKSDWDSFETSWDFKRHPLL